MLEDEDEDVAEPIDRVPRGANMAMLVALQIGKAMQCFSVAKTISDLGFLEENHEFHHIMKHLCDNEVEIGVSSLAHSVDRHDKAVSFEKLLNYVEQNPLEFPSLQAKHANLHLFCRNIRSQLTGDQKIIDSILWIRDKSLAHTDKSWLEFRRQAEVQPVFGIQELYAFSKKLSKLVVEFSEHSNHFGDIHDYFNSHPQMLSDSLRDFVDYRNRAI